MHWGARRRSLLVAALVCAAWCLPATARAAEPLARSGPLAATLERAPLGLAFTDADGDVLRTAGGEGAYGPLAYAFDLRIPVLNNALFGTYRAVEAETVWFHATRALSVRRDGDAALIEAATNDPLGHRLEIRVGPGPVPGALSVTSRLAPGSGPLAELGPTVSGAAFASAGGERHLGFGERSNAVDQTGGEVFSWAEEGPFSSGAFEPVLRPALPQFTFPSGPTATNLPIPWMLSTRGLGVLVDRPERSTFHLRGQRAWRAEAESPRFAFTVFAGPRPADALRRYSDAAGRQPEPAPWLFGPWLQAPDDVVERFRREDVPLTVRQTYTHYLPCGAHVGREEAERERVRRAHAMGLKITTYFNPHVCRDYAPVYEDAAARGLFVRNAQGDPYLLSNPFTADGIFSEFDFTVPAARERFAQLLDDAIDAGYDGWMEDFGEYTPPDARFANGETGRTMHNRYPVDYHCTSYAHTRKRMGRDAAVFVRSGFHGVQPCARVVWGGDPTEDWSCADGLCAAVHQALSTGLSGIAYWGSDIGGFHAVVNRRTDAELQSRWVQLGAVSGVMRTQQNGYGLPGGLSGERADVWDPAVEPIFRRWAKLRTQLEPYWRAASEAYQDTALPITRHHALTYPDDPRAVRRQTEFHVGDDLLAAPVIEPGARERALYLPPGQWVDLHRATAWRDEPGTLAVRRAELLAGGREVTVPAPLEELPLLVRAGAILPLLPADVDTLADEGEGGGLVHAGDRRGRLRLLAFPRGSATTALPGGERLRAGEKRGRRWVLRIEGERRRTYDLEASMATLRTPLRPCRLTLDGRRLSREDWAYDPAQQVLRARFATGVGRLVVQGRDPRGRCGGAA